MATTNETITVFLDIDGDEFDVQGAMIHEAISVIGELNCSISKPGEALPEPETLLGKTARLDLKLRDSEVRRDYHGVVVEAVRRADADGRPIIDVAVAPRLWRLTKRTNCRIFQEKSTVDIVTEVLEEAGVPAGAQTWNTTAEYAPRVFCCQYRETDYEFISRLLAEEGIIFGVTHDEDEDKILFGDEPTGFGDVTPDTLPFRTLQGFSFLKPQVTNLQRVRTVKPDKVELRDYDFERPSYQLKAQAEGTDDGEKELEVFAFPGRFVDEGVGGRYAEALLHSMQAERDVLEGETSIMTLKVGHRLTIEEHPFDELNTEWMVISIETVTSGATASHEEAVRDFACSFTAVPTETTVYKAPRKPAVGAIPGTQTVFTTGASGSEIHPDEYGRIKARFLWDRTDPQDDTSSCWIRTEQPNTPDSMFLPRVGWEVSLRFHDGDIDRPFCFGRLYNALAPPPYKLPDGKARSALQTATSPGDGSSNELRMDDSGGGEEMFVNASKDLTINVKNNMSMSIGNNEVRNIGSNHTLAISNSIEITIGSNNTLDIGGNQDVKVETYMLDDIGGDHTLKVGGNRDMQIGGDHKHTVTGDQTLDVTSLQTDMVVGEVAEKADGDYTYEASGGLVEITAGNRDFTVAGDRKEMVGLAKIVGTIGGREVEIAGDLTNMVAGAIIHKVKGDKSNKSAGAFTDLVAGAQIIKAKGDVTFEGEDLVAVVMGASVLLVSKPVVMLAGTSVKWDGETKDQAILIVDN